MTRRRGAGITVKKNGMRAKRDDDAEGGADASELDRLSLALGLLFMDADECAHSELLIWCLALLRCLRIEHVRITLF